MISNEPADRRERAAYRRFIRENHPDVGGDPATFADGLHRLRPARRCPGRTPAWDGRYDAPIEVVSDRERLRRQVRRLWRRVRRGSGPPRVR